jgi:hypothetical protein
MREFIEFRLELLEETGVPGTMLLARQSALSDMLELVDNFDDAAVLIEKELESLKEKANQDTDDRLLWARLSEYQMVVENARGR